MDNRTNLVIKETTSNQKNISTTISYINPNATNAQILSLARAINALTTNTLNQTIKETREVLV